MLNIGINSAKVVRRRHATDKIYLNTNLPEGVDPNSNETADVILVVTHGGAEVYLERYFAGVPFEVIAV